MALTIDVQYAQQGRGLPRRKDFEHWIGAALDGRLDNAEVSIRIVDEKEMTELNDQFRGQRKPTNVLSFPADLPEQFQLPLLGDIIICAPVIEREAAQQDKLLFHHWAHMAIHGTLHLMGYDHIEEQDAEQMEALESQILAKLNIPNPYHHASELEDSTQNYERRTI